MTIYSGIFNSVRDSQGNGDKKYDAWWFAKYFSAFIGNGVFPNPSTNLQVIEGTNMQVIVRPGLGWIDGYFLYSDTNHTLDIDLADGVLKRIDRIVMRLDHQERMIDIVVKKGTFASNPVAPVLQRDGSAYELALADVFVANGATQITQANITDQRLNTALCGIVHGTVDQVDTTTLFNQYQSWIEQQMALYEVELATWTAEQKLSFEQWMSAQHNDFAEWRQLEEQEFADWMLAQKTAFTDWMQQEQTDFNVWFESLQNILDGDVAGNLLNLIEQNKTDITQINDVLNPLSNDYNAFKDSKGKPNGLATTDATGNVPTTQLGNVGNLLDFYGKKDFSFWLKKRDSYIKNNIHITNELKLFPIPVGTYSSNNTNLGINDTTFLYRRFVKNGNVGVLANDSLRMYTTGSVAYTGLDTNQIYDGNKYDKITIKATYNDSYIYKPYAVIFVVKPNFSINEYSGDPISGIIKSEPVYRAGVTSRVVDIDLTDVNEPFKIYIYWNASEVNGTDITITSIEMFETDKNGLFTDDGTKISLRDNTLASGFETDVENITQGFLDWLRLAALTNSPPGTDITFDILDNNDVILRTGLKNGDGLQNLVNPSIKVRVNISRTSLDIFPCIEWISISARGYAEASGIIAEVTATADTSVYELMDLNLEQYKSLKLVMYCVPSTSGADVVITFNNDNTAMYSRRLVGSSISAQTLVTYLSLISAATGTGVRTLVADIDNSTPELSGTLVSTSTVADTVYSVSGAWLKKELISKIKITTNSKVGSKLMLFGVKR